MNPPSATTEGSGSKSSPTDVVLHGRRLFFARAAWVALAALTVGLFVWSVLITYEQLSTVCEGNAGCDFLRLSPKDAKVLEGLGLSVGSYAAYNVALCIVSALGYWAIGAILFWKSSGHRVALYASVALVTFGAIQVDTLHWLAEAYPVWAPLPVNLVYFVGEASFFVLFCVFPDGRFVPRWTRWAAVAGITYWLLDTFFPDSSPVSPGNWPLVIRAPLFLGFTATIAAFVVVLLIGWIFALTQPSIPQFLIDELSITALYIFPLLIPLSIGVAILYHRLWDIDLIIRRSLVYGSLSLVLTSVFSITDTLLQSLFFFITGAEQSLVPTFGSVIVIAVGFQPLRNRIQGGVDRLFDRLVGSDKTSESLQ